jgi:hypothetical protein
MLLVQRTHRNQNKLDVKSASPNFEGFQSSAVGTGGIDLEQQVKKHPSRLPDELLMAFFENHLP